MKTIRNKAVKQEIKQYILDHMDFSGYVGYSMETEPATDNEKIKAIYNIFMDEKGWEIRRIGRKAAFMDWLQGLASALTLDFYYHAQMKLLAAWLNVDEDTALEMAENNDFWRHCTTIYFEMLEEARKAA